MHGSPIMKFLCLIAWFITGFVALLIGLRQIGWDLTATSFFQNNLMQFMMPINYIIGLAGLLSLISLGMMIFGMYSCSCGCTCGGCNCGQHNNKKSSGYGM